MRTVKDEFIINSLLSDGVSRPSAEFLAHMVELFEVSETIKSSSKKLARSYGRSERSIRRYIRELTHDFNYIHKKPHYNNDDPDNIYIEYTEYTPTFHTNDLLKKIV